MYLRSATVFAPQNQAFLKTTKRENDDEYLPCYHMSKYQKKLFSFIL